MSVRAYKILTAGQWAAWQAAGRFTGAPIDIEDGYIHLSAADQVAETAEKHFAGLRELVLVEVDLTMLGEDVRWEPSRGGQLFPHVYGVIPLAAVTKASPIDIED
jgi:beta-hydroxylase